MIQKNYKYETYLSTDNTTYKVVITLNDSCKNGHSDFSITGTYWDTSKDKTLNRNNNMGGGAIGDEIAKHFPQFKIFNDLHLCDFEGTPMYYVENGCYHMKDKTVAMEHLMIDENQYNVLEVAYKADDKPYFEYLISKLGLREKWQAKAKEAIEWLEEHAQTQFETSHGVGRFKPLTEEQINFFKEREINGYYLNSSFIYC